MRFQQSDLNLSAAHSPEFNLDRLHRMVDWGGWGGGEGGRPRWPSRTAPQGGLGRMGWGGVRPRWPSRTACTTWWTEADGVGGGVEA